MSKPSLMIVLVEDGHHEMLIFRFLKKCRLGTHQIRMWRSPSGAGSAENWVREQFAQETTVCRTRQVKAETALIVMIDADLFSVQDRITQLDQALIDEGKPPVEPADRIARLVPKRNVETWILCLNRRRVDEVADYKRTENDWIELIPPAALTLYDWTRPTTDLPSLCIDSLRTGIAELKNLDL